MFIRQVKKQRSKSSKVFYQYTLAQTSRVDGKVKQYTVLYLGSSPLLEDKDNRQTVLAILKSKIFGQEELFPKDPPVLLLNLALTYYERYCIKYDQDSGNTVVSIPPAPEKAEFHNVDILGLEVEEVKSFGAEHLCKQVIEKLGLRDCLADVGLSEQQINLSLISIIARAIFSASELKTSQILEINSELTKCLAYSKPITHKQLYAIADTLYEHKEHIDRFIHRRITNMFGLKDKLVIFDISNTYFETRKASSHLATYGRSKEKRNDCPLIVFTAVINAEGFIRHSRIYEGNKADTDTLSDMIDDMVTYSAPEADHTVVIDAGIATEDNLALLRTKGYKYVCVSRVRLKDYPISETNKTRLTDRGKNEVSLSIFTPEEPYPDTWMYVQSEAKRKKESSMNDKLKMRFEQELTSIDSALSKKGGTKKSTKVWERIGRAKQRHHRISSRYKIDLSEQDGIATKMTWEIKPSKVQDDKAKGVYFIRTNYIDPQEDQLWDIYNTIREVESTFRCLKSDLQIRPVHHQNDCRIQSHIYLTILAYQLVNTIRYMLKQNNIRYDWNNIVRIMSTHTIQTIILPTDKKTIHLRKPAKPIDIVQQIYSATSCTHTQTAVKKYVVYH